MVAEESEEVSSEEVRQKFFFLLGCGGEDIFLLRSHQARRTPR